MQCSLRDHAAKICSSSTFHLSQKIHLDERGHSLVWTDDKARAARQSGVSTPERLETLPLTLLAENTVDDVAYVDLRCFGFQVKVVFIGNLLNYEEICSLYHDCEKMLTVHDPARLLLHLYLQVHVNLDAGILRGSCFDCQI